jgi:hypothetical protein
MANWSRAPSPTAIAVGNESSAGLLLNSAGISAPLVLSSVSTPARQIAHRRHADGASLAEPRSLGGVALVSQFVTWQADRMPWPGGSTVVERQQSVGSAITQLGRIRFWTALGCAALTGVVVLARGGARHRRVVFRHHEHHVIAAMNTWTAVSRSLGLAALILVAVTLAVGLVFGRRLIAAHRRAGIRAMHMTISVSALVVIALHIVTLLGASSLGARLDRLLIPWLWPYHRTATALGVLSIYVLSLLGPTYFARRAVGMQRWRVAHRFITAGLALAILHVVGGG